MCLYDSPPGLPWCAGKIFQRDSQLTFIGESVYRYPCGSSDWMRQKRRSVFFFLWQFLVNSLNLPSTTVCLRGYTCSICSSFVSTSSWMWSHGIPVALPQSYKDRVRAFSCLRVPPWSWLMTQLGHSVLLLWFLLIISKGVKICKSLAQGQPKPRMEMLLPAWHSFSEDRLHM